MRCNKCGDLGWIYALSKKNPLLEFAFICSFCDAPVRRGLNNKKSGAYWRPEQHEKEFSMIEFTADSLQAANALQASTYPKASSDEEALTIVI